MNLRALSVQSGMIIRSNILSVSLVSPGRLVHLASIGWRHSCRTILVLWLPYDKGDPIFLEGLLHYCKRSPGKSYPCLLFTLNLYEEIIDRMSSLLSDVISSVAILPIIL